MARYSRRRPRKVSAFTSGPDFIVDEFIEAGRLEWLLAEHPLPELGIHAVLPSNRQVPHRVRVLIDFLAERLR